MQPFFIKKKKEANFTSIMLHDRPGILQSICYWVNDIFCSWTGLVQNADNFCLCFGSPPHHQSYMINGFISAGKNKVIVIQK